MLNKSYLHYLNFIDKETHWVKIYQKCRDNNDWNFSFLYVFYCKAKLLNNIDNINSSYYWGLTTCHILSTVSILAQLILTTQSTIIIPLHKWGIWNLKKLNNFQSYTLIKSRTVFESSNSLPQGLPAVLNLTRRCLMIWRGKGKHHTMDDVLIF